MMAISEATVKKLMETMKAEFSIQLNIRQKWKFWQERMLDEGLADDEIGPLYKAFARKWDRPGKPNLSQFLHFARRNARVKRSYALAANAEPGAPPHVALAHLQRMKEKLRMFGKGLRADDEEDQEAKRQDLRQQAQDITQPRVPDDLSRLPDVDEGEIPF